MMLQGVCAVQTLFPFVNFKVLHCKRDDGRTGVVIPLAVVAGDTPAVRVLLAPLRAALVLRD